MKGHSSPPCPHMAGTRSPVPILYLDESIGFLVPRSFVPMVRPFVPAFRSLVPSFRSFVPYSQIHHTGKAASLTPGIIYTIIFNTLVRRMPVLKTLNSLNLISTVRGGTKTLLKLLTMRRGPSPVCLVRASFLSYVPFVTLKSFYK